MKSIGVSPAQLAEMYSYHPAGAVTAKPLQITRQGYDQYSNWVTGVGTMDADYGAYGEKLGVYSMVGPTTGSTSTYSFTPLRTSVWFTGTLIWEGAAAVYRDAVGTNRAGGARFYPYGDEITSTSNDRSKFATYNRDSFSGCDYADQRYYASTYGRFNTADPYGASGGPSDPGSWNRYSYVEGDPINHLDRQGLCTEDIDGDFWDGAYETIPMEAVYYTPGSCMGDPTFQAVYSTVGAVLKGVFLMAPPPTTTPPIPTCTITVYERGVNGSTLLNQLGITHAYIVLTNSTNPTRPEIFEGQEDTNGNLVANGAIFTGQPGGCLPDDKPATDVYDMREAVAGPRYAAGWLFFRMTLPE